MNRVAIWACGLVLLGATSAPAAVLFERSLAVDRSNNVFASTRFTLSLDVTPSFLAPTSAGAMLFDVSITPADVGSVFALTGGAGVEFDAAIGRLTDGIDEILRVVFTEESTGRAEKRGFAESGFFAGMNGWPDFGGMTIEELRLRIDRFSLVPGTIPLAPGAPPQVDLGFTLQVVGQFVPEPTGAMLAAAAALALARCRQRLLR